MCKLSVSSGQNIILLIFCFTMIAVCSSDPLLERVKRGAGAGNCNGGRHTYHTFCYGPSDGDRRREADVQACFDGLYNDNIWNFGCRTESRGRCRCTVDSNFIWNWWGTFKEARQNLYNQCHGFTNNILERYEGNLYLTATCN